MKSTFYILISLLILTSCESKNDLNGIWIGAYQVRYSGSDSSYYSKMNALLDFSKDEIIVKTFEYPKWGEPGTLEIFKYSIVDSNIIFNSDTLLIMSLTKDSLVLSRNSDYQHYAVFKRLTVSNKKLKTSFKNKAYSYIAPNFTDSIDFINDSLILHIGNVFSVNYRINYWSIDSYKSLDFFVYDPEVTPPLLIDYDSTNVIGLKLYFTDVRTIRLVQIEKLRDTTGLIGNWVWPFVENKGMPLPPPPPQLPDSIDTKLYLRINTDSINIEQYGYIKSKEWKLNSTFDFIYFPVDLGSIYGGVWKIKDLNGDNLVIERNRRHFYKSGKETIWFEKKEKTAGNSSYTK